MCNFFENHRSLFLRKRKREYSLPDLRFLVFARISETTHFLVMKFRGMSLLVTPHVLRTFQEFFFNSNISKKVCPTLPRVQDSPALP